MAKSGAREGRAEYRRTTRRSLDAPSPHAPQPDDAPTEIVDSSGARARRFAATEAKNQFARVLEEALDAGAVVITKHDEPRAVLLSMAAYRALAGERRMLDTLTVRFDAMLERMQRPGAAEAMKAAFGASPRAQGRAAVAAARRAAAARTPDSGRRR